MMIALSLLAQLLHIGLIIMVAPVAAGILNVLEARLTGLSGPPVLLPWRDLVRLSRKTAVDVESISIVSRFAPMLGLGATLSAAALVPSFTLGLALSPLADVLVVVSLLAVARVAGSLAALDAGSALPGLAQQETSALAVLAEPALMLAVVTPALMAGSFNLDLIIGQQREGTLLPAAASALALTALLALVLADLGGAQTPGDGMFSGINLAMWQLTGWLRRLIWIDLIGALFLPVGIAVPGNHPPAWTQWAWAPVAWIIGLGFWAIKFVVFLLGMAAVRSVLGRIARHSLPDLIGVAALLALLAIVMVLASTGMA